MNITDEQIEAVATRGCMYKTCEGCALCNVKKMELCVEAVANRCAELLRERVANPGVWDGAPSNANMAQVSFLNDDGYSSIPVGDRLYRRTPPKDAIRLKAERIAEAMKEIYPFDSSDINIIERELRKE